MKLYSESTKNSHYSKNYIIERTVLLVFMYIINFIRLFEWQILFQRFRSRDTQILKLSGIVLLVKICRNLYCTRLHILPHKEQKHIYANLYTPQTNINILASFCTYLAETIFRAQFAYYNNN